MMSTKMTASVRSCKVAAGLGARPLAHSRRHATVMAKAVNTNKVAAGVAATCSTLLAASQAQAVEVDQVYGYLAADGRANILLLLFAPALGWVGFNILTPFLRQLDNMNEKNSKRSVVGGLGLVGLSLAAACNAEAAEEVMQIAADGRANILLLLFAPALGWVGFNILTPFLRQLDNMNEKNSKRSVVGGLGLVGLSLAAACNAE